MQTFLPYPDFTKSAQCLDSKRLGKQRVEAWQIYEILRGKKSRWMNHPAVRMWRGFERALLWYGLTICREWRNRGYNDSMYFRFLKAEDEITIELELNFQALNILECPEWLGDKEFHASHRSNLLRKKPEHYSKFGWIEPDNLPYKWII